MPFRPDPQSAEPLTLEEGEPIGFLSSGVPINALIKCSSNLPPSNDIQSLA